MIGISGVNTDIIITIALNVNGINVNRFCAELFINLLFIYKFSLSLYILGQHSAHRKKHISKTQW